LYVEVIANSNARRLTRNGELKIIDMMGGVVWVTHFDSLSVPFYQAWGDASKATAATADLLFGLGEVVGAGERHTHSNELLEALAIHQVSADGYEWYVQMKEDFPMRTAGFGLGLERYLAWLFQHNDVRDLQLLPREFGRKHFP
jgi:asparaginyl-tRNA synthetase